jgi:ribosomal protein S18 acetylase RimI-like enzyme
MELADARYTLTDDRNRVDLDSVCRLLAGTYWASSRSREHIAVSIGHSLCFSVFHEGLQVGFARVITDQATHGYLCDVVIDEAHQGKGVGQRLLQFILDHPQLATCRIDLFTRDAQGFYEPFGFGPHRFECLVRYPPDYADRKTSSTAS